MPRVGRYCPGGIVYHVLNRGNDRRQLFFKQGDARAFLRLLSEAKAAVPMRILAWCLMSNHWHLALWPYHDGDLSAFMAWLGNAHVRRHRQHYHTSGDGHLYQGRFKSFPVQTDERDLLLVLRYVEANALRAKRVTRAEDWPWSSLHAPRPHGDLLDDWPIARPADWVQIVNDPIHEDQIQRLRTSVKRGRPFGQADWIERTVATLGLEFTMRPRGRPRKTSAAGDSIGVVEE